MSGEVEAGLEIRSFRTVFDLERRLYRIDRLRLNPGGVPVRGIVYLVALLVATTALSRLPLGRAIAAFLPWYVRYVIAPAGLAALLTLIRIEGRPFHSAVRAMLRFGAGERHLRGLRGSAPRRRSWRPPGLLLLPDGSHPTLRRLLLRGPGALLVARPHERTVWRDGALARIAHRPSLTIAELAGQRQLARTAVIEVCDGVRVDIRPPRRRRGRCAPR